MLDIRYYVVTVRVFELYYLSTVDQWQERRKKAILRNYYKEVDKSQNPKKPVLPKSSVQNENNEYVYQYYTLQEIQVLVDIIDFYV